ncbi:hypothetical protein [Neobacillus mesonae]|uniref:hypothetical protein n=1 Tax=Neobacillus mesonae TaxID=1193713 RepID=UPI0008328806|nr:hypothetical protein [Neobacillus mesonae]
MGKKKKKKSKKRQKEDFGSVEFYCKKCDYTFEIDWETIWDIQECTHGYVGFHLNNTFISCEKCGEIINNDETVETEVMWPKQPIKINDDDLPF